MKKTLIALALSAIPVAALAEVTLYGEIKGGLEYTKANHVDNTVTNVNDWGSFIGFKGEEDLGSGLKAIWQIEQDVSLDHNSPKNDKWASRDSFIGLAGGFGTLRAGYLSDTFKSNEDFLDPWEGNGVRTLGQFERYNGRYTGVRYDSPNWAGFSFNVLYSPEDNNRYDDARDALPDVVSKSLEKNNDGFQELAEPLNEHTFYRDMLAVGLTYENNGWFAQYGYKAARNMNYDGKHKDTKLNGEVHGLDFGYDNGTLMAGLGFRTSKNYIDAGWEANEGAFTFAYTFGNIVPRISIAYGEEKERHVNDPEKNKYTQAIVGVDYNLSKRTTVLASVGYWTNKPRSLKEFNRKGHDIASGNKGNKARYVSKDDRLEYYSFGLGLRHKF